MDSGLPLETVCTKEPLKMVEVSPKNSLPERRPDFRTSDLLHKFY